MKRVLLIDPGKVSESWYSYREMPSLSLGCLGTYLRHLGHDVRIVDMATYKINNSRLQSVVAEFQPDIVGLTSATFNVRSAFEAAAAVRAVSREIFVVLGGAHATALPQLALEECPAIDAVVAGEGEAALADLCRSPRRGIISAAPIENLDGLPFVDWSLFDLSKFKKFFSLRLNAEHHKFTLSLTRGCPYPCRFCFKIFKGAARTRSPASVFAEIRHNYERLGARLFYVADSTLLLFKENIHELCRLIISSGIEIALIVQSRSDTIDAHSVRLLKTAGCETFFVGVESGNDQILKRCGKNTSRDLVRTAVKILAASGIPRIRCSFIVGLEGDTRETIKETVEFAKELKTLGMNRASVHTLDVYPGTDYWYMVERGEGSLRLRSAPHDWSAYSRMYPMTSCGDIGIEELKSIRDEAKALFPEEL